MNRKKVNILIWCFGFMLFSLAAFAKKEPPPPNRPGLAAVPPSPVGLPIDGGLSLLLISGVAYGIYELRRKKE